MAHELPSLNALRAFEATARHLSFRKAAEELHVTAGAVSQQIRRLEEDLAVALFTRAPTTALTSPGQKYLLAVRKAFEGISEATSQLRAEAGRRRESITVSLLAGLATKWLIPRLGRFRALHPQLDIRISTSRGLTDFDRDDVDMAIRHGLGDYAGLASWKLLSEDMVPVCSPALLDKSPLSRPADLAHHTLLHDEDYRDWELWLTAAKVQGIDFARGPRFSDDVMTLAAAIDGQGVALGRSTLVASDIAEGRLVAPLDVRLSSSFAYYIVCPQSQAHARKIATFRDWLISEAAGTQELT